MSKATSGEWFNKSWSPINGKCPNQCDYCYMRRKGGIADRFKAVHDHPLILNEKILSHIPKSGRVFVGSSTDMFVSEVPDAWIKAVFSQIYHYQHLEVKYFFLTKNTYRYIDLIKNQIYPPMFQWFGTTWDGNSKTKDNLAILKAFHAPDSTNWFEYQKFISFEPLLANPLGLQLDGIDWIIIGADSRRGKPRPPKEWAYYLIVEARRVGAMVFVKDNYGYPEIVKELPKQNE